LPGLLIGFAVAVVFPEYRHDCKSVQITLSVETPRRQPTKVRGVTRQCYAFIAMFTSQADVRLYVQFTRKPRRWKPADAIETIAGMWIAERRYGADRNVQRRNSRDVRRGDGVLQTRFAPVMRRQSSASGARSTNRSPDGRSCCNAT
jgi:hypothetical protein